MHDFPQMERRTHQRRPVRLMDPILHRLEDEIGVGRGACEGVGEDDDTLEVEDLGEFHGSAFIEDGDNGGR